MAKQYRRRLQGAVNQYANVSVAYDLSALPYEQVSHVPQRVNTRRVRIRKRVKRMPVFIKQKDQKYRVSLYTVVTLLLIFCGSLGLMLSFATIHKAQSTLVSLQSQLKEKQDNNIALRAETAENFNLAEIERIAATRLGMTKAKPYQIVQINVSKQSYATRNTPVEESEQALSFTRFISFLKNKITNS